MRVGLIGVLVAALALPAIAGAQTPPATPTPTPTPTPTATPTPTPTPTPEEQQKAEERERLRKKKVVRSVYADFRRDGRIDACEHERESLKMARRSISPVFEQDFPDFRDAVTAAIKDHDKEKCAEEEATPTPTPPPTPTPAPTSTPAPTTTPAPTPSPTPTPEPGGVGGDRRRDDERGGGGAPPSNTDPPPPSEGDVSPVQPAPTPAPSAPPAAPPEAQLVVTRPDGDTSLLLPALLLGGALLGLALTGGSALVARRAGGPLAGWGHAWREAAYRATGAWGDFSDWLRLGR